VPPVAAQAWPRPENNMEKDLMLADLAEFDKRTGKETVKMIEDSIEVYEYRLISDVIREMSSGGLSAGLALMRKLEEDRKAVRGVSSRMSMTIGRVKDMILNPTVVA
jgi:hypothetical protein